MAQFGPALKWPWTKLMDVPDLTDELLNRIVDQSDLQAGDATIRELEVLRDDCLIAVMQGLRTVGYGAGEVLDDYERQLFDRSSRTETDVDITAPLRLYERSVPTEWVDYNGHTNDSRYMQLSSEAGDRFLRFIGMDAAYLESGRSFFTVESHINYLAQSRAGDRLYVTVQLLSHDDKRLRLFTAMHRSDDDAVVATAEHMMLHVDTTTDRAAPTDPAILATLANIAQHHDALPQPANAGRAIGQRQR